MEFQVECTLQILLNLLIVAIEEDIVINAWNSHQLNLAA